MNQHETPAGGGQTPASEDRSTSLAFLSGEASDVATPKPDETPAAAVADDNAEPSAYAFEIFADGRLEIRRNGELNLVLDYPHTHYLGEFMDVAKRLWSRKS
jgi:hypothetical protein